MDAEVVEMIAGAGLEPILMPRGEFIREHKHLLKILAPVVREAEKQKAELKSRTGMRGGGLKDELEDLIETGPTSWELYDKHIEALKSAYPDDQDLSSMLSEVEEMRPKVPPKQLRTLLRSVYNVLLKVVEKHGYSGKGIAEDKRWLNSKTPYTIAKEVSPTKIGSYLQNDEVPPSLKQKLMAAKELKGGRSQASGFVMRMMAEAKKKHGGEPYGTKPKIPSYRNPTDPLHPNSTMSKAIPFDFKKLANSGQSGENENPYGASPFIIKHFSKKGILMTPKGKETAEQKAARKGWTPGKKAKAPALPPVEQGAEGEAEGERAERVKRNADRMAKAIEQLRGVEKEAGKRREKQASENQKIRAKFFNERALKAFDERSKAVAAESSAKLEADRKLADQLNIAYREPQRTRGKLYVPLSDVPTERERADKEKAGFRIVTKNEAEAVRLGWKKGDPKRQSDRILPLLPDVEALPALGTEEFKKAVEKARGGEEEEEEEVEVEDTSAPGWVKNVLQERVLNNRAWAPYAAFWVRWGKQNKAWRDTLGSSTNSAAWYSPFRSLSYNSSGFIGRLQNIGTGFWGRDMVGDAVKDSASANYIRDWWGLESQKVRFKDGAAGVWPKASEAEVDERRDKVWEKIWMMINNARFFLLGQIAQKGGWELVWMDAPYKITTLEKKVKAKKKASEDDTEYITREMEGPVLCLVKGDKGLSIPHMSGNVKFAGNQNWYHSLLPQRYHKIEKRDGKWVIPDEGSTPTHERLKKWGLTTQQWEDIEKQMDEIGKEFIPNLLEDEVFTEVEPEDGEDREAEKAIDTFVRRTMPSAFIHG